MQQVLEFRLQEESKIRCGSGLETREGPENLSKLIDQYGCGPVQFTGTDNALYKRHLFFDNVTDLAAATPRDRFEAFARSARDILSQRWVLTEKTYERENAKPIYCLSMELLIGRSLANNLTNLLLDPGERRCPAGGPQLDRVVGAGTGCRPGERRGDAPGYGLRYENGIFKQGIQDGWHAEEPDNWLAVTTLGGTAPRRAGRDRIEPFVRTARWKPSCASRAAIHAHRRSVRPASSGLRWENHQQAAPMGHLDARLFRFPGIQPLLWFGLSLKR